jgi:hypothetical protein
MDAQLFGAVDKPAAIVVSSWDPLVPQSRAFMRDLVAYARANDQSAVAVVLDPAPQRYLRGPSKWPVYMSFQARLHWLFAEGLDGVVRIDFEEPDLKRGVYDLLDTVRGQITLAEVWMRPSQTFGPVAAGSRMAVALYAKKHKLTWRSPNTPSVKPIMAVVHHHLWRGEIIKAHEVVELPPVWTRPEAGRFEVAWPEGQYQAAPATFDGGLRHGDSITVELRLDDDGLCRTHWPAPESEHLVILSGPGDTALQPDVPSFEPAVAAIA